MISCISLFEIINVVSCAKSKGCEANIHGHIADPRIILCIPVSAADAVAAVNLNGIKTLLVNGFSTYFFKTKPVFSNGPRNLLRNSLT